MDVLAFRLLGPVQLHVDGEPVPLGGPRRRALLAYLVVHRHQPTPADRLIDTLWGSDAGPGARHSLQTHVSALRRLLHHPEGPGTITHGTGGYQLSLAGATIDLECFEHAADRAVRDGDPVAAARALELWGGEPLADLPPQPWAEATIRSLQTRRCRVALLHIEADLQAGHAERVLPLLDELLAIHPYDEQLWRQRLLALYRTGRQSEALADYHHLRARLQEDLGVDPGPELAGLQRRILLHDPRIADPGAPPHAVPASISSFVGRGSELTHLHQLTRDHRLVTITGPGGVGKTRTALELAHAWRGGVPDGVFFVDLASVHEPERVADEIADRLGLPRSGQDRLEALTRAVASRTALLVLDNAEHLHAEVSAVVVALLRTAGTLRVIVTSRVALGVTGEVTWRLPPLDLPRADDPPDRRVHRDAVQLFLERTRDVRPAFRPDERDLASITTICHRLDGLPLAIELATGRLRSTTIPDLEGQLGDDLGDLASRDPTVPDRHRTLGTVLRWSTDPLDAATRRVLIRLAVVPGSFDRDLAAAVCRAVIGDDGPALDQALGRLVDHSLLNADTSGDRTRYRMLEVVRDHATTQLGDPVERADAEQALLGWALELARLATRGLSGPDEPDWVDYLGSVRAALRAALGAGLTHDPERGLRLATRLVRFWWVNAGDPRGPVDHELPALTEGIRWLRRLLAVYDGDARGRAGGETALGFLLDVTGSHAEARTLLLEVRDRMDAVGELRLAGWAALYAANASWSHDPDEVLASYRQADERLTTGQDGPGRALVAILEYSYTLDHIGREEARPAMQRFLALTDGSSSATFGVYRTAVLATDALAHGRPSDAREPVLEAVEQARRFTDPATTSLLLALSAWYAAAIGEVPTAARWLAAAELTATRHGLHLSATAASRDRVVTALGPSLTAEVRETGRREASTLPHATLVAQIRTTLAADPAVRVEPGARS
jgi:predicted ATPase/DNA-binding SARP family transcriptional activator